MPGARGVPGALGLLAGFVFSGGRDEGLELKTMPENSTITVPITSTKKAMSRTICRGKGVAASEGVSETWGVTVDR